MQETVDVDFKLVASVCTMFTSSRRAPTERRRKSVQASEDSTAEATKLSTCLRATKGKLSRVAEVMMTQRLSKLGVHVATALLRASDRQRARLSLAPKRLDKR